MIVVYSNQPAKKVFLRDRYVMKIVPGQPAGFAITRDGAGGTLKQAPRGGGSEGGSDLYHGKGYCWENFNAVCNSRDGGWAGSFATSGRHAANYTATASQSTIFNVTGPGGTMGKLVCQGGKNSGQPCELTRETDNRNATDDLTRPTNWTFIPDDADASFYESYVYFGWWMNEAPPDGSEAFGVFYSAVDPLYKVAGYRIDGTSGTLGALVAGDPDPARRLKKRSGSSNNARPGVCRICGEIFNYSSNGSDITGSATYEGGAAGLYAIRAPGVENGSASGAFVADVALTVNFDVDTTPGGSNDNNGITFSGAVKNFRADYAGSNKWVVTLAADKDTTAAGVQPFLHLVETGANTAYTAQWRAGSLPIGEGQWQADFYNNDPAGRRGSGTASKVPDVAGGRFVAGASNQSILMGAFGAPKKTSGQ